MGSGERITDSRSETAVSDRKIDSMLVFTGPAAVFSSVPCRKLGIERGTMVHWIRDRP